VATPFDVLIVGAGVVGAAVARLLSLHDLSVALVEAGPDVGVGTSKANTAILHTGFDATPGSVEARLVARGYELLRAYAPTVGISVEETGAVLVAWDDEQASTLPSLREKARANGYLRAEVIDAAEVRSLEPQLGPGVTGAMVVPDEHLVDPWSTPIAFATEAVANGCVLLTGAPVVACEVGTEITMVRLADGRSLATRFVVNAAGLEGDTVHRMLGLDGFTIRPRRGELIVFDKLARSLLTRTILPVPTAHTKGVLVAPTVFGNVVLGPTADDIFDRTATGSTRAGLDGLLAKGRRIIPALVDEEVTAVYAGLRAATEHSDYQISDDADLRYVGLGGIRSTGLTASMALAEESLALLQSIGLSVVEREASAAIHLTPLGEAGSRPYQSGGRIVCHCERVTADEIRAACSSPVPARDLDGLKRRTRALAGRCQGFYCLAEVSTLTGWPVDR
jgi:glycerol-3-phosphate dehydrogenase